MQETAQYSLVEDSVGGPRLLLSGPLTLAAICPLERALQGVSGPIATIDLAGVEDVDTVGAWIVCQLARQHEAEITGASEAAERPAWRGARDRCQQRYRPAAPAGVGTRAGDDGRKGLCGWGWGMGDGRMLGQMAERHGLQPGRRALTTARRWCTTMVLVRVTRASDNARSAIPIGIVIAQQGSPQRNSEPRRRPSTFVGRITLRANWALLLTAIIVAGRSGSAFTAEIGSMKMREEIDAMRTIGISPIEALVIPRILAATFMMVLLGLCASVVAIVGGAVVGDLTLGIPFWTFLDRIHDVVPEHDLWVGLIKAPVFGLIVALAGCYNGLQVRGNSEEVGRRTTMAVVSAIFAVIVLDAFFAVFFTEIGWG